MSRKVTAKLSWLTSNQPDNPIEPARHQQNINKIERKKHATKIQPITNNNRPIP